jgi:hypothetical protein
MDRITKEQSKQLMAVSNAFTCTGAYAVLIMSGLKRVEKFPLGFARPFDRTSPPPQ